MPGSKPWIQHTVGLTQCADWNEANEGATAGVMKYDDGTLWVWNTMMANYSSENPYDEYFAIINEWAPGSKAWEQLMPDVWTDNDFSTVESSGRFVQDLMGSERFYTAHDGGDSAYWIPEELWNRETTNDRGIFITHKESRTWDYKVLAVEGQWSMYTGLAIYDGYVWYIIHQAPSADDRVSTLYRMDMEAPYFVTEVRRWDWTWPVPADERFYWQDLIDPDTGLPNLYGIPIVPREVNALFDIDDDGFMYVIQHTQRGVQTDGVWHYWGNSWILRTHVYGDGVWELLYYHTAPNYWPRTYNLPDGSVNNLYDNDGPLPIGLGLTLDWWAGTMYVRDGWLYYVDMGAAKSARDTLSGAMFCRIQISDIDMGEPVEHDPENPIVEVLSMTTGPYDSYVNWDKAAWGQEWLDGWEWRNGLNAIHSYPEPGWCLDDDGSILFIHHEFPNWLLEAGGNYVPYVLSRLSPPDNYPIAFTLVFEGNEMKGYGHARDVPSKTKVGTIELSGE
jgi:hypothetical protein